MILKNPKGGKKDDEIREENRSVDVDVKKKMMLVEII